MAKPMTIYWIAPSPVMLIWKMWAIYNRSVMSRWRSFSASPGKPHRKSARSLPIIDLFSAAQDSMLTLGRFVTLFEVPGSATRRHRKEAERSWISGGREWI